MKSFREEVKSWGMDLKSELAALERAAAIEGWDNDKETELVEVDQLIEIVSMGHEEWEGQRFVSTDDNRNHYYLNEELVAEESWSHFGTVTVEYKK